MRGPSHYSTGARFIASKQSRRAISVLKNSDVGLADTTSNTDQSILNAISCDVQIGGKSGRFCLCQCTYKDSVGY